MGLCSVCGPPQDAAATIPNCDAYEPAFAGEIAGIVHCGVCQILVEKNYVFYCVTLMNVNCEKPDLPAGVVADAIEDRYKFSSYSCSADGGYGYHSLKKLRCCALARS